MPNTNLREMKFKLDDSLDPGWARVKVLGDAGTIMGIPQVNIEILEILKPSFSKYKIGQKLKVAFFHLSPLGHPKNSECQS